MSETFGQALRRVRVANRITMYELAQLVGVQPLALSHWEHDQFAPVSENYDKLLRLLPELARCAAPDSKVWRKPGGSKAPRKLPTPHECGDCGAAFASEANLRQHQQWHRRRGTDCRLRSTGPRRA